MHSKINITLTVPSSKNIETYISLFLKKELCNEPSEYRMPSKLLAVSDVEGNFLAFRRLLIKSGVINNKYKWTFGDGHIVILGDCFDRGEQVIECLWLIYSLEDKARAEGGHVHFLLGNHEIMNLNGDWRYVHPKYAGKSLSINPNTALYDANNEIWRWLLTKNIVEKIGNVIFVHGGISRELLRLGLSISGINNRARPYYSKANQLFADPFLSCVFNSDLSPFWYRGYYQADFDESLIEATLTQFQVHTIVTGHTIVDNIRSYFNGKVINIDTDHAAGNSEALLIRKERFYRVNSKSERERIK